MSIIFATCPPDTLSDEVCLVVRFNIIVIDWLWLPVRSNQPHVFLSRVSRRVFAFIKLPTLIVLSSASKLSALDWLE